MITEQKLQHLIDWVRQQPVALQRLFELFPPQCRVQVGDVTGSLSGIFEGDDGNYALIVDVLHGTIRVPVDRATVVSFAGGITPEFIRMVCSTEAL